MEFNNKQSDDAIVISGMSGRFPKANNIQEFANNLYTKSDCTLDPRLRYGNKVHPDVPKRLGLLCDINHFDAGYFALSRREIECMDTMCRISLECTYEAILDAGLNVKDFKGKKIAIFVGLSTIEAEHVFYLSGLKLKRTYCIVNAAKSAINNRIHYWLKTKGKTIVADTACASSHFCVEHAYKTLRDEDYDYAIVIGSNLCLNQVITIQFARLGVLSKDGVCRSFDDNASGYTRSEGSGCLIMQKASTAKRVYAEVVHAKLNCDGNKDQGITFPSGESQKDLLTECYEECGIEPSSVTYVEAHGTGTHVGDPEELNTITEVFCNGRNRPLHIGSVKSNIGHNEPAAGVCGIIKVLLGFHSGLIPPNINYKNPRKTVPGLLDKKLIVVTEPMPWPDNKCLVGVSSFGFGGANGHIILRRFNKHKVNDGIPQDNLPRLVCISARTEESLTNILNDLKDRELDAEYVALYNEIYKNSNAQDIYRGFIVLSKYDLAIEGTRNFTRQHKITLYFGREDEVLASSLGAVQVFSPFAIAIKNAKECLKKFNNQLVEEILAKFDAKNRMHVIIGSSIMQIGIHDTLKLLKVDVKRVHGEEIGSLITYYSKGIINVQELLSIAYFYAKEATEELKNFTSSNKFDKELLNGLYRNNGSTILAKNVVYCGKVSHKSNKNSLQFFGSHKYPPAQEFLCDLGKIYTMGCDLDLVELYPKVKYPVTLQTPMISSLIRWNHDNFYKTVGAQFQQVNRYKQTAIEVNHPDWSFIKGHTIDGRNLFPATGFLYLIWDLFAAIHYRQPNEYSVIFRDVKFIRALNLLKDGLVYLRISILLSGEFEIISDDGAVLVTGKIYTNTNQKSTGLNLEQYQLREELELKTKDVYKELRLRNYNYSGLFKGIKECSLDGTKAKVEWKTNWVSFLDNLLQVLILTKDTRNLCVPVGIDLMVINTESHKTCIDCNTDKENNVVLPVMVEGKSNTIKSGGVMISGLSASAISKRKPLGEPVLETYKFIPNDTEATVEDSVRINMQIILENAQAIKVKVAELLDDVKEDIKPISSHILNALGDLPLIQPEVTIYSNAPFSVENVTVNPPPINVNENYLLVIGVDLLSKKDILTNLAETIKPNTYIMSREHSDMYETPLNLQILTTHIIGKERIILMQKSSTLTNPIAVPLNEDITNFNWLKELQNASNSETEIIVYTRNCPINGLLGLINCVRKEADGKRIKCMLLDDTAPTFDLNDPFYVKQLQKDLAINVYQKGLWGTYRHLLLSNENMQKESQYSYANTKTTGDLTSFTWMEGYPLNYDDLPFVKVHYSAINFRDVMLASGRIMLDVKRIEQNSLLGFEYSGIDQVGRRVMGMTKFGGIATEITPDTCLMWMVPDEWNLAEAATVPCVYSTSLYALLVIGKLKPGESILIHSGTGGVGQAAINIALHYNCEIFVTVGTQEKKEFILKNYPRIKESNIGNSRDTSFETLVLAQTNGSGVDVVLNSLADEKLEASVRCLARGGRFLEIGKFDLLNNSKLSLMLINEGKSYNGVMLDNLMHAEVHKRMAIQKLLIDAIEDGIVKPLINTVFGCEEIESAFRYMSSGKHMGKVLVAIRNENERLPKCISMFYCNPNFCSIILGGLGGFGLELADWLVLRGARKLILTSRRGITNGYQRYRIRTWEKYGAKIVISKDDITTYDGCLSLIRDANKWAPIENIFNLAVILKDKTITNQTLEDFEESFAPKAFATQHLDKITRNLCKTLKNFVVFSSVSCGRGNGGQSNYGMANSIMERICERRKEDGYPGLAIQWGAVGDVGLVAEVMDTGNELVIAGTLQQKITNCLQTLDILLNQNEPIVGSMVVAEKMLTSHQNIIQAVANILGIRDVKTVSPHTKLPEMGMDSMMGVEIKQILEREYSVFLTPQDIRTLTFARLREISEERDTITEETSKEEKSKEGLLLLLRFIIDETDTDKLIVNITNNLQKIKNNSQTVYFFPGYEGTFKSFTNLSSKLTTNAVSFQYSIDCDGEQETITDMARKILPGVLEQLGQSRNFVLVAHSFGTLVAIETALLLEELGYVGQLIFIDGSPIMIKSLVEQQFQNQTINEIQINLLFTLLSYMFTLDEYIKYKVNLDKLESYEDKVNFLIENLPTKMEHTKNYQRLLALSLYKRLLAIKYYKPSFSKIRSLVHLFKANVSIIQNLEEDHGLSRLCHQEVKVKEFDGDHVSILDNDELASEINNLVSDGINDKMHIVDIDRHNGIMQEITH